MARPAHPHQPLAAESPHTVSVERSPGSEEADPIVVDCDRCSVRGAGCPDCVVTFLLGGLPDDVLLDTEERRALDVLASAGLVPPLRMVHAIDSPGCEDAP